MIARRYTDRLQLWRDIEMPDGFGGFTNKQVKVRDCWCAKETKGAGYKFQNFGLNEFRNPVIFRIRGKYTFVDEDMFVVFKGERYDIKGVEDVNLNGIETNIYTERTP